MFLLTILTGLQNDNIRGDLRPYLKQGDVRDKQLIDKVNLAWACETERQSKKKLVAQPCVVKTHSEQTNNTTTLSSMALLQDLSTEVNQTKESIQQTQGPSPQFPIPTRAESNVLSPQTQYPSPRYW